MITVWGRVNSSNVMKLLWLLDEAGLAYRRIHAGLAFGHVNTPEYRAKNPLGLVPVLEDGDVALFESNTILRYLAATRPTAAPFHPVEPVARARVEAWMDAQLATFQPVGGIVFQQLVRTPPERRDEAALAAALEKLAEAMAILEAHLTGRDWLAGDAITLADVAFGPLIHRWFALPLARPDQPALRAYYTRLLARPAYVTHCAVALT